MKRTLFFIFPAALVALLFCSCATNQTPPYAALSSDTPYNGPLSSSDFGQGQFEKPRYLPEKTDRPGLATGWGEEKTSQIVDKEFFRASSKPAGIDSIYYNNKMGIRAMSIIPSSVEPLQSAAGGLVEWGIKGGFGFLPAYKDYGFGRRMVTGEKGQNYSIFVRNKSKSPLEIVASVDGLDVQDGKTASFSKRGYIIDSGKSASFDGFRTSVNTVAAFKFSSVANSYANLRYGDTRNVGVIGLAVFTEKGVSPWMWMPKEATTRSKARAFAEAPGN